MPFYYVWIAVIASWVLTVIEVLYLYLVLYIRNKLDHKKENLEVILTEKLRLNSRSQLENVMIDQLRFPQEIISIIMEMLPEKDENWKNMSNYDAIVRTIDFQRKAFKNTMYIYPTIRIISDFVNFILIMMQYGKWYNNNSHISDWDKYCGFIIALLYLSPHAARGFTTVFEANFDFHDYQMDDSHERIIWIGFGEFIGYIALVSIISFPIWIGGIFVYITTTLLAGVVGFLIAGIFYILQKWLFKLKVGLDWILSATIAFSFLVMWFIVVILVCAMELYAGQSWIDAYKIGFLGQYCEEEDYFQFSKWNQYQWDIKYLIISWFLF